MRKLPTAAALVACILSTPAGADMLFDTVPCDERNPEGAAIYISDDRVSLFNESACEVAGGWTRQADGSFSATLTNCDWLDDAGDYVRLPDMTGAFRWSGNDTIRLTIGDLARDVLAYRCDLE